MIFAKKIDVNFDGCRDYEAIINVIDQAIAELLPYLAEKMLNSDVVEYELNTSQSIVKTKLRTNEDFTNTIGNLEKLRALYVGLANRRDGNNIIQLQDADNFIYGGDFI